MTRSRKGTRRNPKGKISSNSSRSNVTNPRHDERLFPLSSQDPTPEIKHFDEMILKLSKCQAVVERVIPNMIPAFIRVVEDRSVKVTIYSMNKRQKS